MPKHAFVTGATGFLGVNLVQQLHADGYKITAIHRNPVTHPVLKTLPVNWQKASLFSVEELKKALPTEPFVVFHLAASTTQWAPEFAQQTKSNVDGTANILQAIKGSAVEAFIHTSSITAFGFHQEIITEKTPFKALESGYNYGITKYQSEVLAKKAGTETGVKTVVLNPCHIIGPWDTHNWIQLFNHVKNETLPGIPPASGNFAWVQEVAKAHIAAVTKGANLENYILGGPKITMLELIQEMQLQLGKKLSTKTTPAFLLKAMEPVFRLQSFITKKEPILTPDKVRLLLKSFEANDSKARTQLGYTHKTVPDIVAETLKWMETR